MGILVSHKLSWNNHVDVISSKTQKMLNVLYRTCKDINDIRTKKLLYIAWVCSRLEYPSMVWSPHTKRNINNLEQVQRRATRFILGRDYSEYELLSKLNLLPLTFVSIRCQKSARGVITHRLLTRYILLNKALQSLR